MPNQRFNRWLYRGGRPNRLARAVNGVWARVFATGLGPGMTAALEVTGRTSGRPVTLPIVVVHLGGEHYLVSMLGENTNWVRNVRAAGGRAVLVRRGRTRVTLEDVPAQQRAPIIKRYCQIAPGGRVHIPVDPDAPLQEFAAVAGRYPVFRVTPEP
ncbi:nitroreductase/quinone reductase family protein [Intrasporangium sp.]|uniref:nitroreductase/quinone reductase family protein n=1 Tax=Intrasporangium sp. TaxID=1925024 RepID=UPI003221BA03